jgi:proline iminopeptidase
VTHPDGQPPSPVGGERSGPECSERPACQRTPWVRSSSSCRRAGVRPTPADGAPGDGDIVDVLATYARLTEHPGPAVRAKATADWCAWEDAVVSGETGTATGPYGDRPSAAQAALVRICAHYFSHGAWLEEGAPLRNAHRLTGIPSALIHGQLDLGSPLHTAWQLARAWPDAELTVVAAGHLGNATTRDHVPTALDRFAHR